MSQKTTRRQALVLSGVAIGLGVGVPGVALAKKDKDKAEKHAKIITAIGEMEAAREYLKKAPHEFGGHRAKAVELIGETIRELRKCLDS